MARRDDDTAVFYTYLEENNQEAIVAALPKLLRSFSKLHSRFDRILKQSDNQQLEMLKSKKKVEESHKQISILLNNAGQGFLYFDKDMKIGSQYSKEVVRIFDKEVEDQNITNLLYPNDQSAALFLATTLQDILEADDFRQEILISLLQNEFFINNMYIELEYKILDENSFMLILTDITAKKELAQKIKDEQQVLKMVVETVTLFDQFISVKEDYEILISKIKDFKSLDKLSDLRKEIHTYKGLFAQKEMVHIVKKLHDFESLIDNSLKENIIDEAITNTTQKIMQEWFDKDMQILIDILGEDFFKQSNRLCIDKQKINDLYNRVISYLDTKNTKNLVELGKDLLKLQNSSLCILMKPYEKLVEQLALKLDKYVNPLEIECDEVYVSNRYKPFINSLVHLFRNSVDHGIEALEDRYEKEKEEYGTIKCVIKDDKNNIIISIGDDGAGIDEQKIKNLAVQKGIYTQEEVDKLAQDEVLLIIFNDAFSTNDVVTDISGRGVGLASVLDELTKLNGVLEIKNDFGKGVEFTFSIPKD